MKLYIVRHTQTKWNVTGQAQGHHDSPLTAKGVEQAHDLAERLQPLAVEIESFYSSDLGRCLQTAEIIGRAIDKEPVATSLLRERSYGDATGQKKVDVWKAMDINDLDAAPPAGESANQLAARIEEFLSQLTTEVSLSIVHDGVVRYLLSKSLGIHPYSPEATNQHGVIHQFSLVDGELTYSGEL